MTAHAGLKDKVTFHADAGAARGGERRPTCPLFSLNIHRRIDGVHPARLRVVLKNFHIEMDSERETGQTSPSGAGWSEKGRRNDLSSEGEIYPCLQDSQIGMALR